MDEIIHLGLYRKPFFRRERLVAVFNVSDQGGFGWYGEGRYRIESIGQSEYEAFKNDNPPKKTKPADEKTRKE